MDLFLIRHGESSNNALADASQRVADPELTATGRAQAERVAAYLAEGLHLTPAERAAGRPFLDRLYCSAMIRALQTAQEIGRAMESAPEVWVAIHEIGGIYLDHGGERGVVGYPGLTRAEIAVRFPASVVPAEVGEDGWWNEGVETNQQVQRRAIDAATALLARAGEKTRIGLVTHAGFMSLLLRALDNKLRGKGEGFYRESDFAAIQGGFSYEHDNTAITRISLRHAPALVAIQYVNRTEHLPSELQHRRPPSA